MGWPKFMTRVAFGPIFKNRARVRNVETDFSAETLNAMLWQLAGMNGCVPRAMAICTVAGSTVTIVRRWFSWDPDGTLPVNELTITRSSEGVYAWAFANATYNDDLGNPVTLTFDGIGVDPCQQGRLMSGDIAGNGRSGNVYSGADNDTTVDASRFVVRWY